MRSTHRSATTWQCSSTTISINGDRQPVLGWSCKRALDQAASDNLDHRAFDRKRASPPLNAVSSPSRCGSDGCSWPATPRISCRDRRQGIEPRRQRRPLSLARLCANINDENPPPGSIYSPKKRVMARVCEGGSLLLWMTSMLHTNFPTRRIRPRHSTGGVDYLVSSQSGSRPSLSENLCRIAAIEFRIQPSPHRRHLRAERKRRSNPILCCRAVIGFSSPRNDGGY